MQDVLTHPPFGRCVRDSEIQYDGTRYCVFVPHCPLPVYQDTIFYGSSRFVANLGQPAYCLNPSA